MSKGPRYLFIDGLRGVAALWVVLFHVHASGFLAGVAGRVGEPLLLPFAVGWVGVPVFFVLSGFAISQSLLGRQVDGPLVGRFLLRRQLRLDPPYWGSLLLSVGAAFAASRLVPGREFQAPSAGQLVAHLLYLQELLRLHSLNEVYWTLCLEIQFYLLFCLLLWLAGRAAPGAGRTRLEQGLLGAALLVALGPPLLGLRPGWPGTFLPQWHGFLVGVLVCQVHHRRLPAWLGLVYPALLLVAAARAGLAGDREGLLFSGTCGLTALLLGAASRSGGISRWLGSPLWQWLGRLSYSLYLVHLPVSGALYRLAFRVTPRTPLTEAAWVVPVVLCNLLVAWGFHWLLERPSLALSHRVALGPGRALSAGRPAGEAV